MTDFADLAEPLERSSDVPLWAQLERELRRRMELGHFADRFPTDRELIEVYEVSRHTARHAVAQLGADGIVRRARGVGTSVDHRTFERSLGALYSLFQVVEEAGIEQHSVVRALERVTDAEVAERLDLDPDTELVLIDRIRYAGDEPLAIDRIWLPADVAEPLLDADFTHTSLYNELERTLGKRPGEGWEQIHPKIPTADERDILGLDEGEAVFAIERLGACKGEPIEWRLTLIRGDRFTFVADWTAGQRNELRIQMTR
ncbi:MAG: GntR family transcriptional regulator [Ilumatobacter fluminis]|uniref:GntR family transcriptional regulator n=1 Tax=Ilumatobacter fluminis TaxID=467091 RepID=A0A4V3EIX8_9ACTN|nr:GntR family transcriptional regulator [Ilumatobacter fluminis]TDT16128.1 GntR family transcriptional regulator [Ilumatobacter fluminis]